jgi:putative methionine-R-sulfoxide reductase with GAF domain
MILYRFSSIIFSQKKEKEIFFGVAQLCIDVLNLQDFAIYIHDEKQAVLQQVLVASKNRPFNWIENDDLIRLSLDQGITGKCARLRQTILVEDTKQSPDYIQDSNPGVTELAVPIVYNNELLGVIDTESAEYGRYDARIIKILEGIASLLAIKLNELANYKDLEQKTNIFSSVIKDNPTCVALLDEDLRYIEVSNKWREQFLKKKDQDIIGRNHFKLYLNIPYRWKQYITSALSGKSIRIDRETYQKRNGDIEIYKAQMSPWFKHEQVIGGFYSL